MITKHPAHIAEWDAAQQRNTGVIHPAQAIAPEAEHVYTSFPLQQPQQQHRNPQGQPERLPAAASSCPAPQPLGISSCITSSDQSQQQLLAGHLSGAGKLLGAVMHSLEAKLQREIQHFAGAVVQRHKETLLKEIQSLSLTAAASGQHCQADAAAAGPSSCNTNAATSMQFNCGCSSAPTAEGAAANGTAAAASVTTLQNACWTVHLAAAGNSSSPTLPLTSSGSNEPRLLDQMPAGSDVTAAAAATVTASASYNCSHQPTGNIGLGSVAPTVAGNRARAKPAAAAAAAGGSASSCSVTVSPFARQCQQAAVCQLLQAPEQQQQQLQHVHTVTKSQVQLAQQQAVTDQSPLAAPMQSCRQQLTCCCHNQQQQQQLPQSPAGASQHSVAAAASDDAAAVLPWQYDQLTEEDMQQLLDAIEPDAADMADDEPISENIFAEIDALINDSECLDFPEVDASLGLIPGPNTEFALLQLDSLQQQNQQQLQHSQQHCEAQQQQQHPAALSHQQQQQQNPYAVLQVDVPEAPFLSPALASVAASNFSPAGNPYSNSIQQLPAPCSQPVWQQQQQQQLPLMTARTATSCRSAASDNVYHSDTGCNGQSGKAAKSRAKGRAAAASAIAKNKSQKQQQEQQQQLKKKRSRKVEAAVPVKRANSDRGCSSGAAAALRAGQWAQTQQQQQLPQQWSTPAPSMQRQQQQRLQLQSQQSWPHNRQQQQQPAPPQRSVNLAAQLPAWLTRQVAITQSLISGTR